MQSINVCYFPDMTMQLNNSTISYKPNCNTKTILLGDIPTIEFLPDLHLFSSLKFSNGEMKKSVKHTT